MNDSVIGLVDFDHLDVKIDSSTDAREARFDLGLDVYLDFCFKISYFDKVMLEYFLYSVILDIETKRIVPMREDSQFVYAFLGYLRKLCPVYDSSMISPLDNIVFSVDYPMCYSEVSFLLTCLNRDFLSHFCFDFSSIERVLRNLKYEF